MQCKDCLLHKTEHISEHVRGHPVRPWGRVPLHLLSILFVSTLASQLLRASSGSGPLRPNPYSLPLGWQRAHLTPTPRKSDLLRTWCIAPSRSSSPRDLLSLSSLEEEGLIQDGGERWRLERDPALTVGGERTWVYPQYCQDRSGDPGWHFTCPVSVFFSLKLKSSDSWDRFLVAGPGEDLQLRKAFPFRSETSSTLPSGALRLKRKKEPLLHKASLRVKRPLLLDSALWATWNCDGVHKVHLPLRPLYYH